MKIAHASVLAILLGSISSCAGLDVESTLDVQTPITPPIQFQGHLVVGGGGTVTAIPKAPPPPGTCLEVTSIGSDGAVLETRVFDFTEPIIMWQTTPGTVREIVIWKACGDGTHGPFGGLRAGELRLQDAAYVWGIQLAWTMEPADCFALTVDRPGDFDSVHQRIDPILAQGIGAFVADDIHVGYWQHYDLESDGLHLQAGLEGHEWRKYDILVNDGAWMGGIDDQTIRYDEQGWDVIEALIPLSALTLGGESGVSYQNRIDFTTRWEGGQGFCHPSVDVIYELP